MSDSTTEGATPGRRGTLALVVGCAIVLLAMAACDAFVATQRRRYDAEIARLRGAMSQVERERADALIAGERNKLLVALELMRRQARIEPALHLSVALDSGAMYLEREGALLRSMPVQIGPERRIGIAPDTVPLAAPRGVRTIASVLSDSSAWEMPEWVYVDRGLAVPPPHERTFAGALGPAAVLLDGGALIYSLPSVGPLSDATYVMPGAVRAQTEDLRAILPNLSAGMRVYFY
jgi:hypothetical protein